MTNGATRPRLVEHPNPLTVAQEVEVQWWRPKIDLAELAKLHKAHNWSINRLAAHFGRSRLTIRRLLQNMEQNPSGAENIKLWLSKRENSSKTLKITF